MKFESVWTYDKLWLKAKVYIQKALIEDREGEMFPFWAAIALELVARATLAKIHPVLLADPREGEHLLYVFGFQKKPKYTPISIPTNTVLERCEIIVPNFTDIEKAFCKEITIKRNEELHSGNLGFDNYHSKKWLSKYYKTLKVLLDFQEKTLSDFLGKEEAEAAEEMIADRDATLEKTVRDKISFHKKYFESLSPEIQTERIINYKLNRWSIKGLNKKDEKCPSCSNDGVLTGKLISVSPSKVEEFEVIQNLNVLPTNFKCFCCELELANHLELDVVEIGGQYKLEEVSDLREYYDAAEYEMDFDYGND